MLAHEGWETATPAPVRTPPRYPGNRWTHCAEMWSLAILTTRLHNPSVEDTVRVQVHILFKPIHSLLLVYRLKGILPVTYLFLLLSCQLLL